MPNVICRHVYESVGGKTCPDCGKHTFEVNWVEQNELNAEWKLANPNAKSDGWWSI